MLLRALGGRCECGGALTAGHLRVRLGWRWEKVVGWMRGRHRATCNDKCQKSINSNCRLSARWAAFISWACAWGAWVRILCCQLLFPRRWRRHVYLWPVRPSPSPSSLARVRASRRVISRASATIRASHIVAPRHLSNRTLHSLQFFQCQSDCRRLARQCEHTRTVAGWPSSIRIDTPKQHVAVPARAVRVVGGCRSEHHRKRFARIREVFTT